MKGRFYVAICVFVWIIPICLLPSVGTAQTEPIALHSSVGNFVRSYCVKCHKGWGAKGDRDLGALANSTSNSVILDQNDVYTKSLLKDVLDQLNLGEMPPNEAGVPQPSVGEVKTVVAHLTKTLDKLEPNSANGQTVLRRLNRREYRNTIEDLLGLENLTVDHTRLFPSDESHDGFTNIGEALTLSESHLDHYLDAADAYLRMAIHFGDAPKQTKLHPKWGYEKRQARTPWMYRLQSKNGAYLDIGAGQKNLARYVYQATYFDDVLRNGGIQNAGYYRITLRAEAIRRLTHPYDPKMIPTDLKPKMQLGLYVADNADGVEASGEALRRRIGLWDLNDGAPETYEVTVWLAKGAIPFLNWDNGPGSSDWWMRNILQKYHDDIEFRGKEGAHAWHVIGKNAVPGRIVSDVWQGPMIRVHDFGWTGPLPITHDSRAQKVFFDGSHDASKVDVVKSLTRFANQAFRRKVTSAEIKPFVDLVKHAEDGLGRSRADAIFIGMKAMLVTPDFLYLREDGDSEGNLTSFELANRLSYFLWSSMPDAELRRVAASGEILRPSVLRSQAQRMLLDSRSQSLVDGLCSCWLRLDKLGSMPPDSQKFAEYYRDGLEENFREETRRFLNHLLKENRPLSDFLKSDYSFLNQSLAKHYGIDGVEGSEFRRVKIPAKVLRGGLLGHGSILTATANGVDTSPVVRGIWVLENILGIKPSPPPPDVEPLEPDVRGTTTLKQRLEKHKTVATCAECHRKFDPLGFPLEFYDAIGGLRTTYVKQRWWNRERNVLTERKGSTVDGNSELVSGEALRDLASLQEYLLTQETKFCGALTRKLLTYATGRDVTYRDHKDIDQIVKRMSDDDSGLRTLVLQIVGSKSFRRR